MKLAAPGSAATLALAVGLCALALTLAEVAVRYTPNTWIQRDGRFYTNVNTTLVEGLSLDQGEFCASWYDGKQGWNRNLDAGWSNVALGANGEHLPKHPVLLPLLSTPLFWAFGLHGTLVFNVLMFGLIALGAFALARRYASAPAAAFAALALPLATGVRDHAYDYHVDVLMLALFVCGMALMHARRGFWAGLLIGATVVLRPTALLWLPSLVLILAALRDWRTLRFALLGGAIPLALFAASNAWLYGMPWWSGYNRVIVVVNGEPQIADVSGAFSVPFEEGLETLWSGPYGVRHRLTLMAGAIPGLVFLLRRRPAYVIAALLGVAASIVLFAQYRWYGDRFLWPSCALLVPALAVTFDALARRLRKRPEWRAPTVAALASAVALALHTSFAGPLEAHRAGDTLGVLATNLALFAALAFGLTRAAERAGAGPLAIVAPLALILLPGVRERAIAGGPDLTMATAVCLALGARTGLVSILFALFAAYAGATALGETSLGTLIAPLTDPAGRPLALLLAIALTALPFLGRRAFFLLPLVALAIPRVASLGGGAWPLFALALIGLPLPALAIELARILAAAWRAASARGRFTVLASSALALLLFGAAPRLTTSPFRIASYEGVRTAKVWLGDIPCDFLAWEHLNWECSTHDRGVHNETGLATSAPLHVGGREEGLFLISTVGGRARTVRWEGVPATDTLHLRWAVPDEMRGGGHVEVRVDGEELATILLSRIPDLAVREERLDTRAFAGREVALELEMHGPGRGVVVDGGFE